MPKLYYLINNLKIVLQETDKTTLSGLVFENQLNISSIKDYAVVSDSTGSDTNFGTVDSPFKTIAKAIESGYTKIALFGGKYFERIDLSKLNGFDIELIPLRYSDKVYLYAPSCIVATSENAVAGYTKVYSASCDKTFASGNNAIYQDGVADTTTEITERYSWLTDTSLTPAASILRTSISTGARASGIGATAA